MDEDPHFVPPRGIKVFSTEFKPVWLKALKHAEADLRRQICESIDRAHRFGVPDLEDTAELLMELIAQPDQHPAVRLAAARTLITLEADQSAALLWKHAVEGGRDMAQLVEPALAQWDYKPAREVWLKRLKNPNTSRQYLKLAIEALTFVKEKQALEGLMELVHNPFAYPDVRLSAARSAGILQTKDLETQASKLATGNTPQGILNRLLAVHLIAEHSGERAEAMLKELALDNEPAVASIALHRLFEIDPELVAVLAPQTLHNFDSKVRHVVARSLVVRPSIERVKTLALLLDDPHPKIRGYIRDSLFQLAEKELLETTVREEGMKMLATDRWRGLEQASLLLSALDHKPAAPRLVELLEFERPEVLITAAWGLRKLAIPETVPSMYDKTQRVVKQILERDSSLDFESASNQLSHLFEAFGLMDYRPPEDLMRKFVPKDFSYGPTSRAAAIWAIGYFYQGKEDPDLAKAFRERLADVNSMPPEFNIVRRSSAISLGRMKSQNSLELLRKFAKNDGITTGVGHACYWAVYQLTGEPIPKPGTFTIPRPNWVLEPLKKRSQIQP